MTDATTAKRPHGSVKMMVFQLLASAGSYGMTTQALARACACGSKAMSGCMSFYAKQGLVDRVRDRAGPMRWVLAPGVQAAPVAQEMAQQLQHAVSSSTAAVRAGVQHMLAGAQRMMDEAGLCWLDVAASADQAQLLERALPVIRPNIARGQVPAPAPVSQADRQLVSPKVEGVTPAPAPRRKRAAKVLAAPPNPRPFDQPVAVVKVKTAPPRGDVITPPGVKVTRVKAPIDTRFHLDPATFKGGELMAEWRRLRGIA